MINKLKKFFLYSNVRFSYLAKLGVFNYMSDEKYLKKKWWSIYRKKLDLKNPKTYNEKIQWLKLYDRNPKYTQLVDKYEVKKYIADVIGEEYIIPTIGIYNKFNEIDFKKLPNQFVIKTTHNSGGVIICKNKSEFDIVTARHKINQLLKCNYYYYGREWPYKNVKPRIIIEKYMEDTIVKNIRDYKFFCFDGKVKIFYISDCSHTANQKIIFYDDKFNELPISRTDYKKFDIKPKKPVNFEKMLELSKRLSMGIPHVRVDWYEIDGNIYFGEMTFYTGSGWIPFTKEIYDIELGNYIELPLSKKEE